MTRFHIRSAYYLFLLPFTSHSHTPSSHCPTPLLPSPPSHSHSNQLIPASIRLTAHRELGDASV
ncbi:hypothetical protein E2C01_070635 [Portunus trituberculatus]|uniref:Uncharacterized protein n=1 Tax=Portunus trituberculatus TaxID=210409 RepID=A0A5B7I5S8_PORTR|nr:hypothetical protein [Portunus trituberculatus]